MPRSCDRNSGLNVDRTRRRAFANDNTSRGCPEVPEAGNAAAGHLHRAWPWTGSVGAIVSMQRIGGQGWRPGRERRAALNCQHLPLSIFRMRFACRHRAMWTRVRRTSVARHRSLDSSYTDALSGPVSCCVPFQSDLSLSVSFFRFVAAPAGSALRLELQRNHQMAGRARPEKMAARVLREHAGEERVNRRETTIPAGARFSRACRRRLHLVRNACATRVGAGDKKKSFPTDRKTNRTFPGFQRWGNYEV